MNTKGQNRSLFLATVAFIISFAVWGLISGLSPLLKKELGLSATAASAMIAVPVLLGSVGRIPMGMLTDRFGGRLVLSTLLIFALVPATALAMDHSFSSLLFWGFWLGMAGTSFAVGIAFVSKWFPPERQGLALGIFGTGNVGQSIAVFLAPLLAGKIGIPATFILFSSMSCLWGLVIAVYARNAPVKARPPTFQENLRVLKTRPLSWVLSLFYFLTFGGFVALGISLPILLKETFLLTPEEAGARAAVFIVVATAARPVGGWLADRFSGTHLLLWIFVGLAALGWLMGLTSMYTFTLGALGSAALLGLGNGCVFKLVPRYFPAQVGTVTGLVGASGGLGGFFPPIVLGILKDLTGSYSLGFAFLSLFAVGCAFILWGVFLRTPQASAAGERA